MRPILRAGLVERGSTSMTIGPDANVLCDSSAKGEEAPRSQRHCTGAGAVGNDVATWQCWASVRALGWLAEHGVPHPFGRRARSHFSGRCAAARPRWRLRLLGDLRVAEGPQLKRPATRLVPQRTREKKERQRAISDSGILRFSVALSQLGWRARARARGCQATTQIPAQSNCEAFARGERPQGVHHCAYNTLNFSVSSI